jgi:hypothetical protein
MERRALVLALALTLPLALYGIPYAYAVTMSSTYVATKTIDVPPAGAADHVECKPGDYATGVGGYDHLGDGLLVVTNITPAGPPDWTNVFSGSPAGFSFSVTNHGPYTNSVDFYAICQTPITVAGVGVPEFGSLYVAIALGAVVYFMLSRRFARRPTISAQVHS